MGLTAGTRLGPYEIVGALGAGGMGEVYRARDTKLGREVALKILPDAFAHDPDRVARFQREAQVLASLSHANIGGIYGLEESPPVGSGQVGVRALVLELVEGPTLADRIAQGPIACDDALTIAVQIAAALEAAHELGIVHRDLKPSNIKLRPDGTVKVLDFGLAKALAPESSSVVAGHLSASPTITSPALTRAGVILGTAAYMSPEQAKGAAADKRSDIWAFGCVLYEMLTGQIPFQGQSVNEVVAGILKVEVDFRTLPGATPEHVRRLLGRCLQKDPRRRLRDIADAIIEIEEARTAPPALPSQPAHSRRRERAAWLAVVTLLAIVTALALVRSVRRAQPAPEARLDITTPATVNPESFALSPDGTKVVYAATTEGRSRLWLRSLDSVSASMLPGTEDGTRPFWSPDSRTVAFFADGRLKQVDIAGGSPQVLANALNGLGGAWSTDGTIVFVPNAAPQTIWRISASGGESAPVSTTRPRPQQFNQASPQFMPDGRHFIYMVGGPPEIRGVYLAGLEGEQARRLADADGAAYTSDYLIFLRQGTALAQAFDTSRFELSGNPFPIADQVATVVASPNGTLVYRASSSVNPRRLMWFDRRGRELGEVEGGAGTDAPALSPDGRRIAVFRTVGGNFDLWTIESRGLRARVTIDPAVDNFPVWSPDGRHIAFSSTRMGGPHNLFAKSTGGEGAEVLLLATDEVKTGNDWSADGRYLLFRSSNPKSSHDLWVLPIEKGATGSSGGDGSLTGGEPIPVARTSFSERDGQFSPDAKWIAFQSDESGRFEIYVQPFPGPGAKRPISPAGGTQVRWRRDGKELFYVALDGQLMAVPMDIAPGGSSAESGAPVPLFAAPLGGALQGFLRQQYDVSPDGQRFLINAIMDDVPASPLTVILNWKARP